MVRDCPAERQAVANDEMSFKLLKARKRAFSHLNSKRRFVTARADMWAVVFMNPPYIYCWFKLDISMSYHHVISESKKVTAHELYYPVEPSVDFSKNEVL